MLRLLEIALLSTIFFFDNVRNGDASFSKSQILTSLEFIYHTIQLRVKRSNRYRLTVSNLHSCFCCIDDLSLIIRARLDTISEEQHPTPLKNVKLNNRLTF